MKKLMLLMVGVGVVLGLFLRVMYGEEELVKSTTTLRFATSEKFWERYLSAPFEANRFQIITPTQMLAHTFLVDTASGLVWQLFSSPDTKHREFQFVLIQVEGIYEKFLLLGIDESRMEEWKEKMRKTPPGE